MGYVFGHTQSPHDGRSEKGTLGFTLLSFRAQTSSDTPLVRHWSSGSDGDRVVSGLQLLRLEQDEYASFVFILED